MKPCSCSQITSCKYLSYSIWCCRLDCVSLAYQGQLLGGPARNPTLPGALTPSVWGPLLWATFLETSPHLICDNLGKQVGQEDYAHFTDEKTDLRGEVMCTVTQLVNSKVGTDPSVLLIQQLCHAASYQTDSQNPAFVFIFENLQIFRKFFVFPNCGPHTFSHVLPVILTGCSQQHDHLFST